MPDGAISGALGSALDGPMGSAPGDARTFRAATLTIEEAERFAALFVPIWEMPAEPPPSTARDEFQAAAFDPSIVRALGESTGAAVPPSSELQTVPVPTVPRAPPVAPAAVARSTPPPRPHAALTPSITADASDAYPARRRGRGAGFWIGVTVAALAVGAGAFAIARTQQGAAPADAAATSDEPAKDKETTAHKSDRKSASDTDTPKASAAATSDPAAPSSATTSEPTAAASATASAPKSTRTMPTSYTPPPRSSPPPRATPPASHPPATTTAPKKPPPKIKDEF